MHHSFLLLSCMWWLWRWCFIAVGLFLQWLVLWFSFTRHMWKQSSDRLHIIQASQVCVILCSLHILHLLFGTLIAKLLDIWSIALHQSRWNLVVVCRSAVPPVLAMLVQVVCVCVRVCVCVWTMSLLTINLGNFRILSFYVACTWHDTLQNCYHVSRYYADWVIVITHVRYGSQVFSSWSLKPAITCTSGTRHGI